MIWSDRNKELYLSCGMFQMILVAFPPERDIWREFGSNLTVMRLSGRGRGTGRIPFSLRSCAISLSFFYFFLPLCCSLSFFEDTFSLVYSFFIQLSSCSHLQPISGPNLSILFFSVQSTTPSVFPLYNKFAFFFFFRALSNWTTNLSVWVERVPEQTNLFSWSNNRIII